MKTFKGRIKTIRWETWEVSSPVMVEATSQRAAIGKIIDAEPNPILEISLSDTALKKKRREMHKCRA